MSARPLRSRQPVPAEKVERLSISVSAEDKSAMDQIATRMRVSLAWVVRDALTRYLEVDAKKAPSAEKGQG